MCEPVSITTGIAAGISLIGAAVQAAGQAEAAGQEMALLRTNARLAEDAAGDALLRGNREAGVQRFRTGQLVARQRLAVAKNGFDMQSGSALDALADTRLWGELDAQTLKSNAAREAFGYRAQAWQASGQRQVVKLRQDFGVAGSILGGVGGLAAGAADTYRAGTQTNWGRR